MTINEIPGLFSNMTDEQLSALIAEVRQSRRTIKRFPAKKASDVPGEKTFKAKKQVDLGAAIGALTPEQLAAIISKFANGAQP